MIACYQNAIVLLRDPTRAGDAAQVCTLDGSAGILLGFEKEQFIRLGYGVQARWPVMRAAVKEALTLAKAATEMYPDNLGYKLDRRRRKHLVEVVKPLAAVT